MAVLFRIVLSRVWTGMALCAGLIGSSPALAARPVVADPLSVGIQQKLTAPQADPGDGLPGIDALKNTLFGSSVALSADGKTAVVGAPQAWVSGLVSAGSAYVYAWTEGGWQIQQKLTAQMSNLPDVAQGYQSYFGTAVTLSADGNTVLVGAPGMRVNTIYGVTQRSAGAVYAFGRNGSVWGFQKRLIAQLPGAPAVNDVELNGLFGSSVALSGDGNTALVGALATTGNNELHSGAAYVYTRSGADWNIQEKLSAQKESGYADTNVLGQFGSAVQLSADGDTALVGAFGGNTTPLNMFSDVNAAYIYSRAKGVWRIQQKLTAQNSDGSSDIQKTAGFGASAALSADGGTVLIGAMGASLRGYPSAGAAYLYSRGNKGWGIQQKLTAQQTDGSSDLRQAALFGKSVALSADGKTAAVGAFGFTNGAGDTPPLKKMSGAAYVYARTGKTWRIARQLTAQAPGLPVGSEEADHAMLGTSVALTADGANVFVGAMGAPVAEHGAAGAAYVYALSGVSPLPSPTSSPAPTISPAPTATPVANPSPAPTVAPSPVPTSPPAPTPVPLPQAELSVVRIGEGSIVSSVAGIDCGSVCTASFGVGSVVTLTAVPAEGYKFKRWSGAGCAGKKPCVVHLDKSKAVKGRFVRKK